MKTKLNTKIPEEVIEQITSIDAPLNNYHLENVVLGGNKAIIGKYQNIDLSKITRTNHNDIFGLVSISQYLQSNNTDKATIKDFGSGNLPYVLEFTCNLGKHCLLSTVGMFATGTEPGITKEDYNNLLMEQAKIYYPQELIDAIFNPLYKQLNQIYRKVRESTSN